MPVHCSPALPPMRLRRCRHWFGGRRADACDTRPFGRLADSGGRHPGDRRRADRRPACARWRVDGRRGGHSPPAPGEVAVFDTAPTALLGVYGDALPPRYAKALRTLSIWIWCRQSRLRAQRRHPMVGSPAQAGADPSSRGHPRADGASRGRHRGRASCRSGRWCLAASPHVADPGRVDARGAVRSGPTPMCRRGAASMRPRP